MIDVLRKELSGLQSECGRKARDMKDVVVTVRPEKSTCPQCQEEMEVQKSHPRKLITVKYGNVLTSVITLKCKEGCRTLVGSAILRRPNIISRTVPKRSSIGYDIEVEVGLQRYLHFKQREEIKAYLWKEHSIDISTGKITNLAYSFAKHFKLLHEKRSPAFRKAIEEDGGYPVHVDATGDCGTGTLFVAIDGWRKWVLGAWRLTTECSDQIRPCLNEIMKMFGAPNAIMRDYGRAIIPTVQEFVDDSDEEIKILGCHQHFCAFVGKDLLKKSYDQLGLLHSKHGFKSPLAAIVREWGKRPGVQMEETRSAVKIWHQDEREYSIPAGPTGIAILRSNVQWVLDIQSETNNLRFPFELPHLVFYNQCKHLRRACDAYLKGNSNDSYIDRSLKRLATILDPIITDNEFHMVTMRLRKRNGLFGELRSALRVTPKITGIKKTVSMSVTEQLKELNDIKQSIDNLKLSFSKRFSANKLKDDTRNAIDKILKHLAKHEKSLSGHVIQLPPNIGGAIRLIERTNITAEGFFGCFKRKVRRQTGKKVLTQELESIPPESALIYNLRDDQYVKILCESIEKLPEMFAELDREEEDKLAKLKSKSNSDKPSSLTTGINQIETASLSRSDKNFVRMPFLKNKILLAASSRTQQIDPIQM